MATVLALAGFMGSGKSTVGRKLAERLGWRFLDLDEAVVRRARRSIPDIFATEGEAGFRAREAETLAAVLNECAAEGKEGMVLALGGGVLENPAAASLLKRNAVLIYLEVNAEEAWKRVTGSDRPLAQDFAQFAALLAKRKPTYEALADIKVCAMDKSPDELAEEIARVAHASGLDDKVG
ncbi:MAG: shikimate kinase [Thermoleophilia bacterium]|nr:shikimate kinase [Thermoleophilia bacterium]